MTTIKKEIVAFDRLVTLEVNHDTYTINVFVEGNKVASGELKDATPQGVTDAVDAFTEDTAKGAVQTYLEEVLFNQPMKCMKSFDTLGGAANVAMVAPYDTSTECGCLLSQWSEEDEEWVVVDRKRLELQDDVDVMNMLEAFTQGVADEIAVCYAMTGELLPQK